MKQFYLITYPEQLFFFRDNDSFQKPVVSLNLSEDVLGRIIPYFKRKEIAFSLFWNSSFTTADSIAELIKDAEVLFLDEDYSIKYFREKLEYKGKIALFVSGLQLENVEFFKKYKVLPIVSTSKLVDFCEKLGLESIFFSSSKRCIASNGTCISKNGRVQTFLNCDSRCREKTNSMAKVDYPFSLRPIKLIDKNIDKVFVFSEELNPKSIIKSSKISEFLEKNWNYRFPIGKEILEAGKNVGIKRFFFRTNPRMVKTIKDGLTFFWGYSGNIYKGKKIEPLKLFWKEENKNFFVTIKENVEKLLLIQRFDVNQINEIKTAKHFLTTLPQQKVFERKKIEKINKNIIAKKVLVTVLTDDVSKSSVFKSGFAKRTVFNGNLSKIPKDFHGFALVVDIKSIKTETLKQLKGVVVTNFVVYDFFKNNKDFSGEILFHPLYVSEKRNKPWFITTRTPVFISDFVSEKPINYTWPREFVRMTNNKNYSVFYKERKFVVRGNVPELWIDVSKTDSRTAMFLKKQSEQIIFTIKKSK